MLTLNEKKLCADALNGTMLMENDADYHRMMIGTDPQPDGTCSGLYAEISDAIKLNSLDTKWEVDGPQLLRKIHEMTPVQRETLMRCIAGVWQRNDDSFEIDLDNLAL